MTDATNTPDGGGVDATTRCKCGHQRRDHLHDSGVCSWLECRMDGCRDGGFTPAPSPPAASEKCPAEYHDLHRNEYCAFSAGHEGRHSFQPAAQEELVCERCAGGYPCEAHGAVPAPAPAPDAGREVWEYIDSSVDQDKRFTVWLRGAKTYVPDFVVHDEAYAEALCNYLNAQTAELTALRATVTQAFLRIGALEDENDALRADREALEARAKLADEIRPLVEVLAKRIGRIPFAAKGEEWEVFEAYTKIARDGNNDGPCWLARYDAITQYAENLGDE